MNLLLSDGCPIFDSENAIHLHKILGSIADGWHHLIEPEPGTLRGLLGESVWSTYDIALMKTPKRAAYAKYLYEPTDCGSCDPACLATFLTNKVILLVENATTDGGFIMVAASRLRRGAITAALEGDHASIHIAQGGGIGELPKELRRQAPGVPKIDGLPPRFVVVADSDARSPGHVSEGARAVMTEAQTQSVDFHILSKRSIENYVPGGALQNYAFVRREVQAAVSVITGLPAAAWDHYPMKPGLPATAAGSLEEEAMYPTGTPREAGMGDFITDFLNNFERHLHRHELQYRDHSGDLEVLLDRIERNI